MLKQVVHVGIVIDRAPYHEGDLLAWVEEENKKDLYGTKIVIEYIDKCLTSISLPCDVIVNKSLKNKLRRNYLIYASKNKVSPGKKSRFLERH